MITRKKKHLKQMQGNAQRQEIAGMHGMVGGGGGVGGGGPGLNVGVLNPSYRTVGAEKSMEGGVGGGVGDDIYVKNPSATGHGNSSYKYSNNQLAVDNSSKFISSSSSSSSSSSVGGIVSSSSSSSVSTSAVGIPSSTAYPPIQRVRPPSISPPSPRTHTSYAVINGNNKGGGGGGGGRKRRRESNSPHERCEKGSRMKIENNVDSPLHNHRRYSLSCSTSPVGENSNYRGRSNHHTPHHHLIHKG